MQSSWYLQEIFCQLERRLMRNNNKQSIVDQAVQMIELISGLSMGAQANEIFEHMMSVRNFQ